ncbi:hypothetical protein E2562_026957 [Oryza meyeriana var. granulata]|uniref:Uncharacterized protein n=1 Tax=Oryza meyeriana var. granulata TaxID=110450 RepID=A0A6G1BQ73_9ORYZ|nr:hypothetical protein E2562_026957 [Oryza meyeriana var. granulata]
MESATATRASSLASFVAPTATDARIKGTTAAATTTSAEDDDDSEGEELLEQQWLLYTGPAGTAELATDENKG